MSLELESRPDFEQKAILRLISIHEKAEEYVKKNPNKEKPAFISVDGILQVLYCLPETVKSSRNLSVRDDDIFICTTPKSGTTLCQYICLYLVNRRYLNGKQDFNLDSPFIEMYGGDIIEQYPSRRVLKTHMHYEWVPKSNKAKYICCIRNPKDALISYYYHVKNLKVNNWNDGNFNVLFEMFINDDVESGGYFRHVKSWLPHFNDSNVLVLLYEEMSKDIKKTIIKIGNFIGGEANEIIGNNDLIGKIVDNCSFEGMKKKNEMFSNNIAYHTPTFVRKGGSRNWKNLMTKEQSDRIDKKFYDTFKGTTLENLWANEMKWDN
uniref:Sulfotransfer_1 domain-containing protein n=1 Tax=Parastrongyloides trichosuri TaxID=131310 RepID=A0A0N4ZRG8_PARTI